MARTASRSVGTCLAILWTFPLQANAACSPDSACGASTSASKDHVLLQVNSPKLLAASKAQRGDNQVTVGEAGGWGGQCTCPDGQVYWVGDEHNACGSLACIGGTPGTCNEQVDSKWAHRKVVCAPAASQNVVHESGAGGWGGKCTCPDGQEYWVGDEHNHCGSLACEGGTPGTCNQRVDAQWAHRRVQCAAPNGVPAPAPAPPPAPIQSGANTLRTGVPGIGNWGGSCTCPDGQVYHVGDNNNNCGTLACFGGTPGTCNYDTSGPWRGGKTVHCGATSKWTSSLTGAFSECSKRPEFRVEHWDGSFKQQSCDGTSGSVEVKVLSYNLWWWNLYGHRNGNHNSAGKLIMNNGPYDIIGFQEIDDAPRILNDAGLAGTHTMVEKKGWPHNKIAIAYKHTTWDKLAEGWAPVGHDAHPQNYGYRGVNWVRLRHKASGKTVFFMNHHGMLPINIGGDCGGENGALNMLKVIANYYVEGDMIIMVGDFNAEKQPYTSATVGKLESALYLNFYNWVDNIFSSCSAAHLTRNLGTGGSDHPALEAVYKI